MDLHRPPIWDARLWVLIGVGAAQLIRRVTDCNICRSSPATAIPVTKLPWCYNVARKIAQSLTPSWQFYHFKDLAAPPWRHKQFWRLPNSVSFRPEQQRSSIINTTANFLSFVCLSGTSKMRSISDNSRSFCQILSNFLCWSDIELTKAMDSVENFSRISSNFQRQGLWVCLDLDECKWLMLLITIKLRYIW